MAICYTLDTVLENCQPSFIGHTACGGFNKGFLLSELQKRAQLVNYCMVLFMWLINAHPMFKIIIPHTSGYPFPQSVNSYWQGVQVRSGYGVIWLEIESNQVLQMVAIPIRHLICMAYLVSLYIFSANQRCFQVLRYIWSIYSCVHCSIPGTARSKS